MDFRKTLTDTQKRIYKAIDSYNHRLQRAIGTFGRNSAIVKGMMEQANFIAQAKQSIRGSGNIGTGKQIIERLEKYNSVITIEKILGRATPANILAGLEKRFGIDNKTRPKSNKQIKERLPQAEQKLKEYTLRRDLIQDIFADLYEDEDTGSKYDFSNYIKDNYDQIDSLLDEYLEIRRKEGDKEALEFIKDNIAGSRDRKKASLDGGGVKIPRSMIDQMYKDKSAFEKGFNQNKKLK